MKNTDQSAPGLIAKIVAPTRVDKPWGYELIWARTDRYVAKILHVNAGHSLSLQYHERKDETLYLLSGEIRFWLGASADALNEIPFNQGGTLHLAAGMLHRLEAVTTTQILEASTPEMEDFVRLGDWYGGV